MLVFLLVVAANMTQLGARQDRGRAADDDDDDGANQPPSFPSSFPSFLPFWLPIYLRIFSLKGKGKGVKEREDNVVRQCLCNDLRHRRHLDNLCIHELVNRSDLHTKRVKSRLTSSFLVARGHEAASHNRYEII